MEDITWPPGIIVTILSAEITRVSQDLKKGLPKLHKDRVSQTIFPIFPVMFTIIIFLFQGGGSPRIPTSNAPEIDSQIKAG